MSSATNEMEADAAADITLSVIVLTWERPDMLAGCLQRLRQHLLCHMPVELIIADDGSTDPQYEAIYSDLGDARLIVNEQRERRGPGWTINSAYEMATKDYVIYVEDDCYLKQDLKAEDIAAFAACFAADPRIQQIKLAYSWHGKLVDTKKDRPITVGPYLFKLGDWAEIMSYSFQPHFLPRSVFGALGRFPADKGMEELEMRRSGQFHAKKFRWARVATKDGQPHPGWFHHEDRHTKSTKTFPGTRQKRCRIKK